MSKLRKLSGLITGLGAFTGITYYLRNVGEDTLKTVHASWTTNYEPSPCSKWDRNWDHRSPSSLSLEKNDKNHNQLSNDKDQTLNKSKTKAVRHLILIRHGQYEVDGATDADRVLTKLGQIQAELTGKRLSELKFPYTNLVKSTMTRAEETSEIIEKFLPDVPVSHCALLREGAPIPPEPQTNHWKPEKYFFVDGARIEAAFRKYFYRAPITQADDSYTVLVCHANVIRYLVCRALQFPAEAWLRMSLNHGSITWISITHNGGVVLRCLGESGHMPPDFISSH